MSRRVPNWLIGYKEYAEGPEVPPIFNLWVGISCIAAAAQRDIYMEMDFFQVHSNLYIMLTSPAGRGKKSTAMKLGRNLLRNVGNYGAEIHFSTQAASSAALIQQFVKLGGKVHQSLTCHSLELGSLLGTKNDDMTIFLTDIFDCNPDWDKQTVSRGLELIEKPWLNLLAGTTPTWLGDNLSNTALEGGFISRSIFVYDDTRRRVAIPKMTDAQKRLRQDLTHDLAQIVALKGTFRMSAEAEAAYVKWYEGPERDKSEVDAKLATYYERKGIHVIKVAMILALAESDSLVVEQPHVVAAIGMLSELEGGMRKAFTSVGKNQFSTDLDRIEDQVLSHDKLSYKQILAMNIHSLEKKELDENLETLASIGKIVISRGWIFSPVAWELEQSKD